MRRRKGPLTATSGSPSRKPNVWENVLGQSTQQPQTVAIDLSYEEVDAYLALEAKAWRCVGVTPDADLDALQRALVDDAVSFLIEVDAGALT